MYTYIAVGWYLSMKPFDAFLKRLQPSENVSQLMNRRHRLFSDPNNKRTLGIMLVIIVVIMGIKRTDINVRGLCVSGLRSLRDSFM